MSVPELVTDYAVILPPNLDKGIVVYTIIGYTKSTMTEFKPFSCDSPLKAHSKLRINKGVTPIHNGPRINKDRYNYIYFRAPATYPITLDETGRPIPIGDPSTLSSDETFPLWNGGMDGNNLFSMGGSEHAGSHVVKVRVDPERTYVFFSEYRYRGGPVLSTKIKLSEYIEKLKGLITPSGINPDPRFYKQWEIVVKTPTISPEYYVKCEERKSKMIFFRPPQDPAQRLYYDIVTSAPFDNGEREFYNRMYIEMELYKKMLNKLDTAIDTAKISIAKGDLKIKKTITNIEAETAIENGTVPKPEYYDLLIQLLPNIGDATAKTTFEGILKPFTPVQKERFEILSRLLNDYIDLLDKGEPVKKPAAPVVTIRRSTRRSKPNTEPEAAAVDVNMAVEVNMAAREKYMEIMAYLNSLGAVKSAKGGSRKKRNTRRKRA